MNQTRVCTNCGKVLWAGQSCDCSHRRSPNANGRHGVLSTATARTAPSVIGESP